jgi:hypothetical protein
LRFRPGPAEEQIEVLGALLVANTKNSGTDPVTHLDDPDAQHPILSIRMKNLQRVTASRATITPINDNSDGSNGPIPEMCPIVAVGYVVTSR